MGESALCVLLAPYRVMSGNSNLVEGISNTLLSWCIKASLAVAAANGIVVVLHLVPLNTCPLM